MIRSSEAGSRSEGVRYCNISQKSRGPGQSGGNENTEGHLKNTEKVGKVDLIWEESEGTMKEKLRSKSTSGFILFSFLSVSEHVKLTETENLGKLVVGQQG